MLHVLLVEDNPADVFLIREAIRTSSVAADVTIACDGAQALKMLDDPDPTPDLVIMDLNLPKLGGLDVLERHPPAGHPPPVVIFTSSHGIEERRRAMALGASDYIEKPFTLDEYLDVIRGAIEKWMKRGFRRKGRGDVTK
jgi:CheY-like chemotaxis protein